MRGLLLAELKAEEALPTILEVTRQDAEYRDLWFGDFAEGAMIPALYSCGGQNLKALLGYVKEPNIGAYTKSFVPQTVIQIASLDPDRREEVVDWCREALRFFAEIAENGQGEGIVDTEFLGFFISDLVNAQLHELLPEIKALFELQIVGYWISGDYASVERDIQDPEYDGQNLVLDILKKDIYERYEDLNRNFSKTDEDYELPNNLDSSDDRENFNSFYTPHQPIVKEKKVGRNDPCPCGSGKKYKKCCM